MGRCATRRGAGIATGALRRYVDVRGGYCNLKNSHHGRALVRSPAEVTRVAREVGSEGRAGRTGQVPGVAGTGESHRLVNAMAGN